MNNEKCYIKQMNGNFVLMMPDGTPVPYQTDIMVEQDKDLAEDNVASVSLRLIVEVKE